MKYALIRDDQIAEYRDYAAAPESKRINGLPMLRPVVDLPQPAYDPDLHRLEATVTIYDDRVEHGWTEVALDLAEVKRLKLTEIELAAAMAIEPIASVYSQAERETWPIQEAEAVAWTANNLAPTPMLTALATARGETIADVVANVLTKAAAFKALAGATFGKRKAKIDLVNSAATAADVNAITW